MHATLRPLCLALALAFAGGAHGAANDAAMAPKNDDAKAVYWQGHDALKRADWNEALARFRSLEDQLRRDEPAAADAALYWQAYAQSRAGQDGAARGTVERLHRQYPDSRWGTEADALVGNKPAATKAGDDADALAEIAIDGLISAPPERAMPLLKKVLEGNYSTRIKKRALFVLSQNGDATALKSIEALATGSGDPALKEEAVRMLGISGEPEARAALQRIYTASKDEAQRRQLLQAFMIADDEDTVAKIAREDASPAVRSEAVRQLGVMDATAKLKAIYDAEKDPDVRRTVLQAYAIAGDVPALQTIASSDSDEALRVEAIRSIGVAGGGDALVTLYSQLRTPSLRDAALQGLLVSGDSDAVLGLYRKASDVEEKKRLLRTLTLIDDDAAIELIEETLK